MRSYLKQIEEDGFLLLMYQSDELPTGDRTRVEQRLAREPQLREQLEMLRVQATAMEIAVAAEAGPAGSALELAAARRALRTVRQWALTRRASEQAPAGLCGLRLRGLHWGGTWTRIGISVAAGLLLSVAAWQIAGHRSGETGSPAVQPTQVAHSEEVSTQEQLAVMSGTLDATKVNNNEDLIASEQTLATAASGPSSSVEDVVADVNETPSN